MKVLGAVGLLLIISLVKTFENDISELVIFETTVHISQNTARLGLNNANIVNSSRADSNHSAVHERLNKFRIVTNCLNAIVMSRLQRWWRVQRCCHYCIVFVVVIVFGIPRRRVH